MTIRRPAHLDFTSAPGPDARCDDALIPLRQRGLQLHSVRAADGTRHGGVGSYSKFPALVLFLNLLRVYNNESDRFTSIAFLLFLTNLTS